MPDFLGQSTVAADGTANVKMQHNLNGIFWIVEQISTTTAKVSSACTTWITQNGNLVAPSAALTPIGTPGSLGSLGQGTTAAGLPYLYLRASDSIVVYVQGATVGDTMSIRAQYMEVQDTDPLVRGR